MADTMLVTGGYGFIGTNFIRYLISKTPFNIVNVDKKTYAANERSLEDIELAMSNIPLDKRRFISLGADIADYNTMCGILDRYNIDYIVNFAALSHVDNSIKDKAYESFIANNITGVASLLEAMKDNGCVKRFLQVSTDEVYGSISQGAFSENSPFNPSSIYSATKAAAENIVMSYYKTHGLNVIITRASNNVGFYQNTEKLIPKAITNLIIGEPIPLMGDGSNVRDWLHVDDHINGILTVLLKGRVGEAYNISGGNEKTNREIINIILYKMQRDTSWIKTIAHRKGHDYRYAISSRKIRTELGWLPQFTGLERFEKALMETIDWYVANPTWWFTAKMGEASENNDTHVIESLNKYLDVKNQAEEVNKGAVEKRAGVQGGNHLFPNWGEQVSESKK